MRLIKILVKTPCRNALLNVCKRYSLNYNYNKCRNPGALRPWLRACCDHWTGDGDEKRATACAVEVPGIWIRTDWTRAVIFALHIGWRKRNSYTDSVEIAGARTMAGSAFRSRRLLSESCLNSRRFSTMIGNDQRSTKAARTRVPTPLSQRGQAVTLGGIRQKTAD